MRVSSGLNVQTESNSTGHVLHSFVETARAPSHKARAGGGGGRDALEGEETSEAAPEAVRQAVGGGCQSGWGRLLSVTNAIESGTCRQGDSGWAQAGRSGKGGGGTSPPSNASLGGGLGQRPANWMLSW